MENNTLLRDSIRQSQELTLKLGWLIEDKEYIYNIGEHWEKVDNNKMNIKAMDISDDEFSAFIVVVNEDYSSEIHSHNQTEEVFVMKGFVVYQIGSRLHKVKEGESFKINPNTPHKIFYHEGSKLVVKFFPPLS